MIRLFALIFGVAILSALISLAIVLSLALFSGAGSWPMIVVALCGIALCFVGGGDEIETHNKKDI